MNVTTNYIHSRVTTTVKDNSIIEENITYGLAYVLYQPYFSLEGIDSRVQLWHDEPSFTRKNGTPNFFRDGPQIYNVTQWLKGGGTVLGLRLVADNALPSFGVINIRTKAAEVVVEDVGEPKGKMDVLKISPAFVPVPKSIIDGAGGLLKLPDSLQLKQILSYMEALPSTVPGWKDHYITIFKAKGSGASGDNFGITIQLDSTKEEDLEDSRRYFFSFIKKSSTGNVSPQSDTFSLSFNPYAVDLSGTSSEFIDTVIESTAFRKTFNMISVYTNDNAYEELIEDLTPYCEEVVINDVLVSEEKSPAFVDFLSLIDRSLKPYNRFIPIDGDDIDAFEEAKTSPNIDFASGAFLMGGDDGNLDFNRYIVGKKPDQYNGPNKYFDTKAQAKQAYDAYKQALMLRAYEGSIDKNILSDYKHQISVIIDSNNDAEVKKQMVYYVRKRFDIFCYLDCGFVSSVEAAINYRNTVLSGIYDWNVATFPQSGTAYDEYTKRDIDVVYNYDIAYKLPLLKSTIGSNKLMAGNSKGAVATMKSINWIPDDEDEKTELLKNQLNYIEEVRINQFAIMSVRTMYLKRKSYLSVIRNVNAIGEIIWLGRQVLIDLRFEEDPSAAQKLAVERITAETKHLVETGPMTRLTFSPSRTQADLYENSATLTADGSFVDFISSWNFDIIVSR